MNFKQSAFRAFDVHAKGSIKAGDLAKALEFTEVDPDEAAHFIRDLDIDGDGNITYDEFTKHVSLDKYSIIVFDIKEENL